MGDSSTRIGIGMVGYAFMGQAHSQGWRSAPAAFDLPMQVEMTAICGRNADAAAAAAKRFGWDRAVSDYRELLAADDIDVIDICVPGDFHAEIAIAALEAGKHVLCEKPLATNPADAKAMADAATTAAGRGVYAMVGFTNRRVPAIALAAQLVREGRLGTIHQVRSAYLQDWLVDPETPLAWRLQKDRAGSGSLGDLGAHCIDTAAFVTGERITGVSAIMETIIKERPVLAAASGLGGVAGEGRGPVTVDDAVMFTSRLSGGGLATFEATRFASGRKNDFTLEVYGSRGALTWNLEDSNVLHFFDNDEPSQTAGFRRIAVTEDVHPYGGAW